MRIVAGTARGRRLAVPPGTTTRPTTDRVREAVFNSLFSLDAIDDARFVDLFAGSGALGLEALSRGAAHCTFVERDRTALATIRDNIDSLGFSDRCTVINGSALQVARQPFDVALADPPYGFADWAQLFEVVAADIVVAESGAALDPHPRFTTLREKRYGSTVVAILQSANQEQV